MQTFRRYNTSFTFFFSNNINEIGVPCTYRTPTISIGTSLADIETNSIGKEITIYKEAIHYFLAIGRVIGLPAAALRRAAFVGSVVTSAP